MSKSIDIGKNVRSFESSTKFDAFSRVVIVVTEDLEYTAGTETGRTLTMECPWGTQAMADNILASIQGFQYQPYSAAGALLDPAAELGDGITVHGVNSGIYSLDSTFGQLFTASISAPYEEEIDHEFPYVPKQDRKIERQLADVRSTFKVQADLIEAKVSRTGGDSSSFGWILDDSSWTIQSNGMDVLKATKTGLEINGRITATGGDIGGFSIETNSLSYNGQTWGGDVESGIYIGPSGIQLGKNFKVDASGNLAAASGTFSGNVYAGNIKYGGDYGTVSGAGILPGSIYGNRLVGGTITTAYTASGINTSLGYADFSNGVFNGWNTATLVTCSSMKFNGSTIAKQSVTVDGQTIKYLGWV